MVTQRPIRWEEQCLVSTRIGFGVGCGFGVGWGFGGTPLNFLGLGAGGGCGVGLGLGWGFGSVFGSQYRNSQVLFQGMELKTKASEDRDSKKQRHSSLVIPFKPHSAKLTKFII